MLSEEEEEETSLIAADACKDFVDSSRSGITMKNSNKTRWNSILTMLESVLSNESNTVNLRRVFIEIN